MFRNKANSKAKAPAPAEPAPTRRLVVLSILGTQLDQGKGPGRWERWRPSVSICQHPNLLVHRFELLYELKFTALADAVLADIRSVSPETETRGHVVDLKNPWDFEQVYATLHDFAAGYDFKPDEEDYLVHITTGTHVAQICLFLLTESHHLPGKLLQTSPPHREQPDSCGSFSVIDLDLSKYDRIASRFGKEKAQSISFLKSGIETRNRAFNALIERIEKVAIASKAPILLTGPTGAGKSHIARRIFELKKSRHQVTGAFVEVNCATLRGDGAMSAQFGHVKGAFTGANSDRPGLLKAAHNGVVFLDEIGELGRDEQAMLLRALEEKTFLPLGADTESGSNFQLLGGTNRDLHADVKDGRFREDLLARINLWTFQFPGLRERPEDIEPNLQYELDQFARATGTNVTFNKEARERFINFATSRDAVWAGNFRDLNAALARMATLAHGGRIALDLVEEEIERLQRSWRGHAASDAPIAGADEILKSIFDPDALAEIDRFDRVQLADVIRVCRESRTISEAGRSLFSVSRNRKSTANDADRLRKYLARFNLTWSVLKTDPF